MAGGIQVGSEAGSVESKQLDGDIKVVSEAINLAQSVYYREVGHINYVAESYSESKKQAAALPELKEMGITVGCVPDGGMWFDGPRSKADRLIKAAFEAKHQQDGGNAIERWCKNYLLCKGMNPEVKYVTLMSGDGARPGGVLYKFARSMVAANGENCIFYFEPTGFSQEAICNIMISVLGLDLTWLQVKPYLNKKKVNNNFDELFETDEQRQQRLKKAEEYARLELQFSQFAQNPEDPLYPVWHRISKDDKLEAREIVIEMIGEGKANTEIATELVQCFLNKV